eukprot:6023814-Alexandrium_andersonii.AAC.1
MVSAARSARMIQPVSPPYSTRPLRWDEVAAVAATSKLQRRHRPMTPTGDAAIGGWPRICWPFHRGSLRATRQTVGSYHGS